MAVQYWFLTHDGVQDTVHNALWLICFTVIPSTPDLETRLKSSETELFSSKYRIDELERENAGDDRICSHMIPTVHTRIRTTDC